MGEILHYLIYLDESGDLGFNFTQPFKKGGSSRFLTLSAILLPEDKLKYLERIIRNIYKQRKRNTNNELKSFMLSSKELVHFVIQLTKLAQHSDIHFYSISINKQRTKKALRNDPNTLYNYAVKKMLLEPISRYEYVDFMPDSRSEKTNTRWNMNEYLQQMLIELDIEKGIINKKCNITPMDSKNNLALQFVDYYASLVWTSHEFNNNRLIDFEKLDNVHHELLFV